MADGADTTRVVLRVTDEFGAIRPFANDAIKLELDGPAEIIGDNPFALIGGTGAIWIRAKEQAGTVRLTATHPVLGDQKIQFELVNVVPNGLREATARDSSQFRKRKKEFAVNKLLRKSAFDGDSPVLAGDVSERTSEL